MRFYEDEFEIKVPRNKSNHRYYTYKEIEQFLYIKSLKERGLSNNQIKEILKTPEIVMESKEIAASSMNEQITFDRHKKPIRENNMTDMPNQVQINELKNILGARIDDNFKYLNDALIDSLRTILEEELKNNRKENNEDKDTLISENARLRMRLKEKAYETAQLRERVNKLENTRTGILNRVFGLKKNKT